MNVVLVNELVTPQEAWDHVFKDVNTASHADDELDALGRIINGVSRAIQAEIGPVRIRSITEVHDGGGERLWLRHKPIVVVTTVTDHGITFTEGVEYFVYKDFGVLLRRGQKWGAPTLWGTSIPQSVSVQYTAGLAATVDEVPADVKLATLLWVHEMWGTGPANLSNIINEQGTFLRPQAIPPQVDRLLRPYRLLTTGAV